MDPDTALQTLGLAQAVSMAHAQRLRFLLYESAGLFWLGAEAVILAAVIIGRRRMQQGPPFSGAFRGREGRLAGWTILLIVMFSAVILSRHYLLQQPYDLLAGGAATDVEAAALFQRRLLQHLGLWSVFVMLWVLLEAVIVYQGWRGYQHLRRWLGAAGNSGALAGKDLAAMLLAAVALLFAPSVHASPVAALEAAQAETMPYYNALYLLLRVAGAAWVAIEWVAAVILVRSYFMMRATLEARS